MTDPKKSGIPNDGRRSYYTEVARFTNINKHVNTTAGYGHFVPEFLPYHLVNFDGVLNYHCAAHGRHDIHLRWDKTDVLYNKAIDDCMGYTQFLDTKRSIKWNFNAVGELSCCYEFVFYFFHMFIICLILFILFHFPFTFR